MGEHGQGTITQLQNGRYRVAVTMADGRRVWRRARTEREAKRLRAELVEARELELDPSRQTLAAWLRSWIEGLENAKRQRLAPRTLEGYAQIVEQHIIPGLDPRDRLPITRLTPMRVQDWLDGIDAAPNTIRNCRAVLRRALNVALRQHLIPYNPAAGKAVELPRAVAKRGRPLSAEEARALFAAAQPRWLPLWRLALVTGLRFAELMGLTWDDIEADAVVARAQLQRIQGQWVRRGFKSARAVDRIAIDQATVEVLELHRRRLADERTPDWRYFGHVFVDEHGEPYHHRTVLTAFRADCAAAGIEPRGLHDLRRGSATILRELGVAEDTRMARLGHSTTDMARHYGRASTVQDREAVDRLAEAIG